MAPDLGELSPPLSPGQSIMAIHYSQDHAMSITSSIKTSSTGSAVAHCTVQQCTVQYILIEKNISDVSVNPQNYYFCLCVF